MEFNKSIIATVTLIITLIILFLFVIPKYQALNTLSEILAKRQIEYDEKFKYHATITQILAEIKKREDVLPKVNSALPSDISFADLIYFLQVKGAESGLAVSSINFSNNATATSNQALAKTPVKDIGKIIVSLSASGSYQDLKKFVNLIDTSVRLFQVNAVSFGTPVAQVVKKSSTKADVYSIKLELQTYTH